MSTMGAMVRRALVAIAVTIALTAPMTPARAADVPRDVAKAADRIHCRHREPSDFQFGGHGVGLSCRSKHRDVDVIHYRHIARAHRFWRRYVGRNGYFAERDHVIVVDWGGRFAFTKKATKRLAYLMFGHLVRGRAA